MMKNTTILPPEKLSLRLHEHRNYTCRVEWHPEVESLHYHLNDYGFGSGRLCPAHDLRPGKSDWVRFKRALDTLEVWDWEEEYVVHACDGGDFSLEIQWGKELLKSHGGNRFPPGFGNFTHALSWLCDCRVVGAPFPEIVSREVQRARSQQVARLMFADKLREPK